jgi:hypothetical protein
MNFADWRAKALMATEAHASISELSELVVRETLVELHRLVCDAPTSVIDTYREVQEEELLRATDEAVDKLSEGDFSWLPADINDERDWIWTLGVQVRTLDTALLTLVKSDHGPPSDPNMSYSLGSSAFVIPRKHLREPSVTKRNGQTYSRRGLLHHRILPKEINGYEVYLVWNDTIAWSSETSTKPVTVGAALFANLVVRSERDASNGFIITDVTCDDPEGTVANQVEASLADRCFGVIWPELSVPPTLRKRIAGLLRERALNADPRPAPQVLVAGTWHEKRDGRVSNLATVFDGYGGTRLVYQKLIPFVDRVLGPERIMRGTRLPILVSDTHLIAFAICRDYCDLGLKLPYPELDVDLAFVPSMGDESTMAGHQVTAKRIRVLYSAHTFVVQQATLPVAAELGLVLPLPDDPEASKPADLRQFEVWDSYQADHI